MVGKVDDLVEEDILLTSLCVGFLLSSHLPLIPQLGQFVYSAFEHLHPFCDIHTFISQFESPAYRLSILCSHTSHSSNCYIYNTLIFRIPPSPPSHYQGLRSSFL